MNAGERRAHDHAYGKHRIRPIPDECIGCDRQARRKAEQKDMAAAHAEGQHADQAREFCPEC
jgi:hypothetical protein